MRIFLLAAMILVGTAGFLLVAAPEASAFGSCTPLSGNVTPGPHCPGLACIGTSWSYGDYYYTCQYEV